MHQSYLSIYLECDNLCENEKEDPRCGEFFILKNLGCAITILCSLDCTV